ncbi:hypothetical protein F5Y14DRAFT_458003 [Nemania sp. NC0429]|nr:hypothetical protein F5Y14DRAFT_458003 [Nemania sp. NC0429]
MASLGKFTAALLANSQENTLALAALNFDFSLWKVEAPSEYQGLGAVLSPERRSIAESGNQHTTARRLGALFRSKLPPVQNLHRAYGKRVCEIAEAATMTTASAPASPHQLGMFANKFRGVDGTAIWAAATSGYEALGVQLLACMLARFWPAPEATSIWAEIVDVRKQELAQGTGDFDFHDIASLQASITRDQLAEWDASARAWVRTADSVKQKQQVQLRLIVNNLNSEVNDKSNTYESVMGAWISAMEVVESLIQGVPQSVHDGAVLIALSSWHLYPDMVVFQDDFKEITQSDPLVAQGGVLTMGLKASPESTEGVRWSLPLSKLRYYGAPVWTTHSNTQKENKGLPSWLFYIAEVANDFLGARGDKRRSMLRLLGFGQRRCDKFIGPQLSYQNQIWNMEDPAQFMVRLLPERRIEYLRKLAATANPKQIHPEDWIIAYGDHLQNRAASLASAFPETKTTNSAKLGRHYRYMVSSGKTADTSSSRRYWSDLDFHDSSSGLDETIDNMREYCTIQYSGATLTVIFGANKDIKSDQSHLARYGRAFATQSTKASPTTTEPYPTLYIHNNPLSRIRDLSLEQENVNFEFVAGSLECAALFRRKRPRGNEPVPPVRQDRFSFGEILKSLQDGWWDPQSLIQPNMGKEWLPLMVLGTTAHMYEGFPEVSISMDVTLSSLPEAKWILKLEMGLVPWHSTLDMTKSSIFACIAFFETGQLELHPDDLGVVMAMSIEDSLYISGNMVDDPATPQPNNRIYRVLGNIGKPGVSLLIPPADPWVRQPAAEDWNHVDHFQYDGKAEDSFQYTSLHLALTEYRVPYVSSHKGNREMQAYFQEAVVSVHDRGVWVGDVDIIKALQTVRIKRKCGHHHRGRGFSLWNSRGPRVTSIDSWHELLDHPKNPAIVRSHGNCFGRLATAALSAQLGLTTIILPQEPCKGCFSDYTACQGWIRREIERSSSTGTSDIERLIVIS